MSIDAAQAQVTRFRELARTNPDVYEPDLALALYTLCQELKNTDSPITTSYMALLEEGIALHRRLLRREPTSVPQLGLMLCWLGLARYRLGWYAQARDLMEEGLGLIRPMAGAQPDVYETQLALGLGLISETLGRTGDHGAALSAARESVAIWRQLADEQPGKHEYYLANALNTIFSALRSAGRHEEALAAAEESVGIARRLYARDPAGTHARLLANSLDDKAMALAELERLTDALPVMEEAVLSYAEAHRKGDESNSLSYAAALHNLSQVHFLLGRKSDAECYADMAFVECAKRIRHTDSLAELAEVASAIAGQLMAFDRKWRGKLLVKAANRRLGTEPTILGKLIGRFRKR